MGGGLKGEGFFFFLGRNLSEEVVEDASRDTKNWSDIVNRTAALAPNSSAQLRR